MATLRHLQQRAATGLFHVISVSGECENAKPFHHQFIIAEWPERR